MVSRLFIFLYKLNCFFAICKLALYQVLLILVTTDPCVPRLTSFSSFFTFFFIFSRASSSSSLSFTSSLSSIISSSFKGSSKYPGSGFVHARTSSLNPSLFRIVLFKSPFLASILPIIKS